MKKIILALLVLNSTYIFASKDLYNALNVQETQTSLGKVKKVAGILCEKQLRIANTAKYECEISLGEINPEKLFKSLKVNEEGVPWNKMYVVTEKQVGNLVCLKLSGIREDTFSCKIINL